MIFRPKTFHRRRRFSLPFASLESLEQRVLLASDITPAVEAVESGPYDLSVSSDNGTTTSIPGESVNYEFKVTNNGPANASEVSVFSLFSSQLSDISYTTSVEGTVTGHSLNGDEDVDDLLTINVGSSITYFVSGQVAANATGVLSNSITVSGPFDTDPTNDVSTDSDILRPTADLMITNTNNLSEVRPDQSVTYSVVVTNNGPSDVDGAQVSNIFPSELTNVTYASVGEGGATGNTSGTDAINDLVSLPAGSTIRYTVFAHVPANARGQLSSSATVTLPVEVSETELSNNSATDTTTIVRSLTDVAVSIQGNASEAIPGTRLSYEIRVTNIGDNNIQDVDIRDNLSSHLHNVTYSSIADPSFSVFGNSESGDGAIRDRVDLRAGGTVVYTVSGDIDSGATGALPYSVTVDLTGDENPSNNIAFATTSLQPQADLEIAISDGLSFVNLGESVDYSVVVFNHGPSDVVDATLENVFPIALSDTQFTSVTTGGATGNTDSGVSNIRDTLNLPSGSSVTYQVRGEVAANAVGVITNAATVSVPDGTIDINLVNNAASDTTSIDSVVVLGSQEIVRVAETIDDPSDIDVFQWTAHQSGKLIANLHFANNLGDLDFQISDSRGNVIATSDTSNDVENIILPVVSQESYFLRVSGKDVATNEYVLELENFSAPSSNVVRLTPDSDSGMMNDDAITNVERPTILISADLAEFAEDGISILSPTDPTTNTSVVPSAAGVAVEVRMTSTDGTAVSGFASPVGNSSTLFEFTPSNGITEGNVLVSSAIRVFDGRLQSDFSADPATRRLPLSEPFWLVIDVTRPESAEKPDLLRASDSGMSDRDDVTNKMEPAFTGTAEPNAKVRLMGSREGQGLSEIIGQSVVTADGRWEITVEPLIDGIHHIRAEIEDLAGNLSDLGEPIIIEVDTIAPNTPYLDLVEQSDTGMASDDNITNDNTLTFHMTTQDPNQPDHVIEFNYKYRLYVRPDASNGSGEEILIYASSSDQEIELENILDGLTNRESLLRTMPQLPDGVHNFKLEVEDRAGNISHDFLLNVKIDTQAPPATVDLIDSSDGGMLNDDNVTNKMEPAFTGISEVGSKVDILANGQLVGEAIVRTDASDGIPNDGLGEWEVTTEPLTDGYYQITSRITDAAGNVSISEPTEIWIDTTKPNIPHLDLISDDGISDTDNVTSDTTPTITVTAGATVDGGFNEFPNDIKIRIYDRPGDGTGETLLVDSFATLQDFTNLGFFTETLPELAEGMHNLKVEIEDRAGNISDPFLVDVLIDSTEPQVSLLLLPSSDSGMLNNDGVTNKMQPAFEGIGSVGDTVHLFANGHLVGTTTVASDETDGIAGNGLGLWEITSEPLVDGTYLFTAQIEDLAGNTAVSSSQSVTIDTVAPNTPLLDLITDSGNSSTDNITNVSTPTLTITANDTTNGGENSFPHDIKYRLYHRTGADAESLVASSFESLGGFTTDGFFEVTLPELADGVHNFKLEVEDRAGNISDDFLLDVTIDTSPSDLPDVDIRLLRSSDTGASNTDHVTSLQSPAFTGTGTIGDRVFLFANGELVGEGTVGFDNTDGVVDDGRGAWEITSEPLRDGVYTVLAQVEDEAGNFVQSTSITVEIDSIAPNTPFLDLLEASDSGRNNDDNVTNALTLDFSATSHDSNEAFHQQLFPDGQNLQYRLFLRPESGEESLIFDSANSNSISDLLDGLTAQRQISVDGVELPEGLHNLKLEVEDRAGNISHDYLLDVLVDRTPVTCNADVHSDSISSQAGNITNIRTPIFVGTSEANAILSISIDGVPTGTTVALPFDGDEAFSPPVSPDDVAGNWRIETIVPLEDGTHTAVLQCEDLAGNRSTEFLDPIVVDTVGPQIQNITRTDGVSLFTPKPSSGPDPLIHSIVIYFDNGTGAGLAEGTASEEGNYILVGDANGNIPIAEVLLEAGPTGRDTITQATLVLNSALPDDRFTLTISDSISDVAGNQLDGESGARAPFEGNDNLASTAPIFPTGDGVSGGDFVARFTVDSRPEVGTWGASSIWIDTNGNFRFDPDNVDFVNRDITYKLGFTSDDVFAGNFSLFPGNTTDGFDKLAVYGRAQGEFRWLVDTDNDGVPNIDRVDPNQVNGLPVAGEFDGNSNNGDEVAVFDGRHWYFDTTHDYQTNTRLASFLVGYPVVGDFDGDGFDDLGTYADDTFMIDLAHGSSRGWDGKIDHQISFGFIGVRERPVAADMDQDGVDDLGLWVPDREGVTDRDQSEWYFLVSNGESLLKRLSPQDDPVNTNQTIDFTPIPFGPDIYARFGDEFARPVVGNFDPPTLPATSDPSTLPSPEKSFTNSDDPMDVNGDGVISAIDALLVINELNANGAHELGTFSEEMPYLDVNNDGHLSASDALRVINELNRITAEAKSEAEPVAAIAINSVDALFAQELRSQRWFDPTGEEDNVKKGSRWSNDLSEEADQII